MTDKYFGTKTELRSLRTFVKLMRAAEALSTRVTRHLADSGLTISQFGVLEALYHLGPLCQRDIAKKILKSTGNITVVVDNLEKRGLVARVRGIEDRRFLTVQLTSDGEKLISEIFPPHAEAIIREMGILTEEEQVELGRMCKMLGLGSKEA
ncbi:MAG: MarR family winged helix-turn-helix transcriptional regulator [Geobacteraceae bacterium]|jgi:MarR family 2-MHQ and catechol resistance regulon transcriptional repressor